MAQNDIARYIGIDRVKARAPEWLAAMRAGHLAAPRCTATRRNGAPCRRLRMRGADKCQNHCTGVERDEVDSKRAAREKKRLATTTNERFIRDAKRALTVIERRNLQRHWAKIDANAYGSTITLSPGDEQTVRDWLLQNGVDIEHFRHPESNAPISHRAVDRLRWAGIKAVTGRSSLESCRRRVVAALRDDAIYWRKVAAAE